MSKEPTYYLERDVLGPECDVKGKLSLCNLMKYIEQISTAHLDALGITYGKLYESGIVFVLSKMGIKIHTMPQCHQHVLIKTTPQSTKGACFLRSVQIISTGGELLVDCQTAWVIIHPQERKILRPAQMQFYLPCDPTLITGVQVLETRIHTPQTIKVCGSKKVLFSDLDVNQHMNNTIYGNVLADFLPFDKMVDQDLDTIFLHYQNEALYGETITIQCDTLTENAFYVGGVKESQKCFEAVVSFYDR